MIAIADFDYTVIENYFNKAMIINTAKHAKYYELVTSFDIETTSTMVDDEKVAFMYIWQFAFEDVVVYGRTWEEFTDFMTKVSELGNLNHDLRLICYVHNLGFEFQFMRKYLTIDSVFAVDERKPVKCLTVDGFEFKDSYILSGYNLATVAKNLQSHHVKKLVGYLDYDKVRTKDTTLSERELDYCAYDVIIVVDYIHEQIDEFGNITRIPLTNTGRVRKYVRDKVLYSNSSHRKTDYGKYLKYRDLMLGMQLDSATYKRLKLAFQGGFTHANANKMGKVIDNVSSFDFTSSYPTVMLSEKFPMGSPFDVEIHSLKEFDKWRSEYALLMSVKFTNIQSKIEFENYLSDSKCRTKKAIVNNGRIYSADELETVITDVDFQIIQRAYEWEDFAIGRVQAFVKNYLPKGIIESILKLYKDKTTLKGLTTNRVEYMRSKAMLNSMYGMTVTDIVQDNHEYKNGEWFNELTDIEKDISKYNKSKNRFLYYPWGVWVTAYARRNLWVGIMATADDYCYSDTDSIKIEHGEKHVEFIHKYNAMVVEKLNNMSEYYHLDPERTRPENIKGVKKQIGIWDNEGTYDRFKTLGAKRYMYFQDNQYHLTVAGLSKQQGMKYMEKVADKTGQDVFDIFNDELYIPADETGKNTHTYLDYEMNCSVTDYQGHITEIDSLSGIHLSKAEFTLSISRQYANFINHLKHGEIYNGEDKFL